MAYDTDPGGNTKTVNIEFSILCKDRAKYYLFQTEVTIYGGKPGRRKGESLDALKK